MLEHSLVLDQGSDSCRNLHLNWTKSLNPETLNLILGGIFLHTCGRRLRKDKILSTAEQERILEQMRCLRCNCQIETGHKSVALYMFAQTVGVRPRQKSSAQRISFCPQCSVSLAMGPPPDGALNMAAWDMMRDLVGSEPTLTQAAWEDLRGVTPLLPATGTEGDSRQGESAGYFEF